MAVVVIEEDIEMNNSKKACLIHYICVRYQLRMTVYGSILMNIVFQHEKLKNKAVFSVSDLSTNYVATISPSKCLFYFITTFSNLINILHGLIYWIHSKSSINSLFRSSNVLPLRISTMISLSRCITLSRVQNQIKLQKCTVFELDSFTKYSILKNPNDECLCTNNTHFGWIKCGDNVAKDFAQSWIKIVEQNIGKKIMLKDIGQRNC